MASKRSAVLSGPESAAADWTVCGGVTEQVEMSPRTQARMREIGKRAQPRGSGGTKAKGKSSAAGDGWGCPKPLELYGNRSFFVLGSSNAFRRACFKLVDRKGFDLVILVLIILSSITMALETPGNMADEAFSDALFYVDICFTSRKWRHRAHNSGPGIAQLADLTVPLAG